MDGDGECKTIKINANNAGATATVDVSEIRLTSWGW